MKGERGENITVILPRRGWFDIDWREIWASRELLWLLVKRDVSIVYKQTILGPTWFILQPILMAMVFSVVFGRIAKIPTDGLPRALFYLSGLLVWNYFRGSLNGVANAFSHGKSLFSKVYFPRFVLPMTFPISHMAFFCWNLIVVLVVYAYHLAHGLAARPTWWLLLLPVHMAYLGLVAFGVGLIFASLTTKYRDVKFAMPFILQIWMYSSPIIFSLRNVTTGWIKWVLLLNPVTFPAESMRLMLFGTGVVTRQTALASIAVTTFALVVGTGAFNRAQRNFVDTF